MAWFRKKAYTTLRSPEKRDRIPQGLWLKCPNCLEIVTNRDWLCGGKVCPKCNHHDSLTARQRIEMLIDEGTFQEFDNNLVSGDPLKFVDSKPYPQRIKDAQEKTGEKDAVISGTGNVNGIPISIAVMEFHFNGGSMGSVAGEKITRAMERGLNLGIPVIVVCASGGARMQEGILSLMQLAKTSAVVGRLGQARIPYIPILTHPTTAGVLASFAMQGDICIAEPDALVGFAGPRVIEATIKQILPPGFQRSEFVRDHGFIDIVAGRAELKDTLARTLGFLVDVKSLGSNRNSAEIVESAARA